MAKNTSRTNARGVGKKGVADAATASNAASSSNNKRPNPVESVFSTFNILLGVGVMLFMADKWARYLMQLHDNQYWFVNIKEVEREISFRTEQGLYYSYYKHLTSAPSLWQGIDELTRDNITEHGRTINIFNRFNIHQELFLAALWRIYDFGLKPIFFYTYFSFSLQGFSLAVMYVTAWVLSGTWVAGALSVAFLTAHRVQVTRAEFTLCLREHFSLPFIFAQFLVLGMYFDSAKATPGSRREKMYLVAAYVLSFLLAITWQFAQFVLLLQALVLFALGAVKIVDTDKICKVLFVVFLSILTNWYFQYYQMMVLNSLVCSFIPVAILVLQAQGDGVSPGIVKNLFVAAAKCAFAIVVGSLVNSFFKALCGQEADNHIFRFVKSKFGYVDPTDFETRLYLCLPIFQGLTRDYYESMSKSGAFPLYMAAIFFYVCCIVLTLFKRWGGKEKTEQPTKLKKGEAEQPDPFDFFQGELAFVTEMWKKPGMCFHVGMTVILAILAMTTLRMKCFWGPYICMFAGVIVANKDIWNFVAAKLNGSGGGSSDNNSKFVNFMRHASMVFVMVVVYSLYKDGIYKELENLREFYDPDTVELMEWINKSTPPTAAFMGSMQLLAGVRLSTFRPLTNHPHFEDKELRARTKELYQVYARQQPEFVHDILVKYNASYIILEDSICLSKSDTRCNLPSTMDLTNGVIPDDGVKDLPHLVQSSAPRFCHDIRYGAKKYTDLFTKVFENKTFRIYRVHGKSEIGQGARE